MGRSDSTVCSLVSTSAKTPVRPMWSYEAGLGGMVRLVSVHRQKQTRVRLSARREIGAAVTRGELTVADWRKTKTSSQFYAMVTNILAVACFMLPVFVVFSPSFSFLLSSLSSPPTSSPSYALSVTERAKNFRRSPATESLLSIMASVSNGGGRAALRGIQSR